MSAVIAAGAEKMHSVLVMLYWQLQVQSSEVQLILLLMLCEAVPLHAHSIILTLLLAYVHSFIHSCFLIQSWFCCRVLFPDRRLQVQHPKIQCNSQQGLMLAAVPGLHCHSDPHCCTRSLSCLNPGRHSRVQHQSQHSHYLGACVSPLGLSITSSHLLLF